jgi:chemotaxis response regulator CheB
MPQLIRVLVVDDSAFLRKVVSQMLSRSPFIEVVGTARDGNDALEMVQRHEPDVVTLDLVMPGLDGVGFLQAQMARRPLPVVVCSIADVSGEMALRALEAGAVDFVQKPTALAADFPVPVAMVLHMPVGYTEMYAERLNAISALEVREAREGDVLAPGVVLLAPAGKHMSFVRQPDGAVKVHLDLRPLESAHRPSVDTLFHSAADVFGGRVLGVVMTGMGDDGLLGAAHIKAQGGRIVTEAESSCVVYGMPRAVAEASLSDRTAPLDEMAAALVEML